MKKYPGMGVLILNVDSWVAPPKKKWIRHYLLGTCSNTTRSSFTLYYPPAFRSFFRAFRRTNCIGFFVLFFRRAFVEQQRCHRLPSYLGDIAQLRFTGVVKSHRTAVHTAEATATASAAAAETTATASASRPRPSTATAPPPPRI